MSFYIVFGLWIAFMVWFVGCFIVAMDGLQQRRRGQPLMKVPRIFRMCPFFQPPKGPKP